MTTSSSSDVPGITTKVSPRSSEETVARLLQMLEAGGMKVFAVIDQQVEAQTVGLQLRPTTLVIFGNPAAGTPVMDAAPLAALDLPLKILIWVDDAQTKVSYVAPSTVVERYSLDLDLEGNLVGIEHLTDALVSP